MSGSASPSQEHSGAAVIRFFVAPRLSYIADSRFSIIWVPANNMQDQIAGKGEQGIGVVLGIGVFVKSENGTEGACIADSGFNKQGEARCCKSMHVLSHKVFRQQHPQFDKALQVKPPLKQHCLTSA